MAINPQEINIVNIPELSVASSLQDSDLVIIGQGINARKTTIGALKDYLGANDVEEISNQVGQITDVIADMGSWPYLFYETQPLTPPQRNTVQANLDIYSTAQVDALISGATPRPKYKDLFTHTLTEGDVVNSEVSLELPHRPDVRDWYDLHINTSWVKPGSYEILNENILVIHKDAMPYGLKAGAEVIFQYTFADV